MGSAVGVREMHTTVLDESKLIVCVLNTPLVQLVGVGCMVNAGCPRNGIIDKIPANYSALSGGRIDSGGVDSLADHEEAADEEEYRQRKE